MREPEVIVRGARFAASSPVVIVPLTGSDADAVLAEAEAALAAGADCLEWRVDHLAAWHDPVVVGDVLARLRAAAGDRPVLATLRTDAEGGEASVPEDAYAEHIAHLAASGADLVDVECDRPGAPAAIVAAHAHGARVVGSRHHFDTTPPEDDLVASLALAEAQGADICKVAVMPDDDLDVVTLLRATARRHAGGRTPLLTIAMGRRGVVSRVVGPAFGSCATFATVGRASAPGQAPILDIRAGLDALARLTHPER